MAEHKRVDNRYYIPYASGEMLHLFGHPTNKVALCGEVVYGEFESLHRFHSLGYFSKDSHDERHFASGKFCKKCFEIANLV